MNEMKTDYLVLAFLWVLYCALHSFFANDNVKSYAQKLLKNQYKYYRPVYVVFAALSLGLLLWVHFSYDHYRVYPLGIISKFIGYCLIISGAIIMIICIRKYFYELSGLQALNDIRAKNTLLTDGLHKFVRHPLYLGTLTFIWGLFLIMPFYHHLIAALIITMYVWVGIYLEEKKLLKEYGDAYQKYKKDVPGLLPFPGGVGLVKKKSR